jgi:hypothetical protein
MRDGGDRGTYSGTDWYAHNVESMWRLLENQETDNHWRQVSGWRRISELTSTHLSRLTEYRDNLASAWPPEKSAASAAFIARLNYLIAHVQAVHDVATHNLATFAAVTGAISTSRRDIERIYGEYVAKRQQKQDYEDMLAFERASQLPGTTIGPPPVGDADLERLTDKARLVMYDLSRTLVEGQTQIQQPPPYVPELAIDAGRNDDAAGASSPRTLITPIVPIADPGLAGRSSAFVPAGVPTVMHAASAGPALSGTGPPTAATPPMAIGPAVPSSPSVSAGGSATFLPPLPSAGLRGRDASGVIGRTPRALSPGLGVGAKPSAGAVAPASARALPPGGMIGGAPAGIIAHPATGSQPMRRVNPVGGVIGNHRAGLDGGMMPVTGSKPIDRRGGESSSQRWDPDHPWDTDVGVDPVVLPSIDRPVTDPGPAIGLDR